MQANLSRKIALSQFSKHNCRVVPVKVIVRSKIWCFCSATITLRGLTKNILENALETAREAIVDVFAKKKLNTGKECARDVVFAAKKRSHKSENQYF